MTGPDQYQGIKMPRPILALENIHPSIHNTVIDNYSDTVTEVQRAVADNPVAMVGMAQNPVPKKARKMLDEQGIDFAYLEYGNYFTEWRRRNALKMWTGWPTFPMIFVKGTLIGGASNLQALIDNNELSAMLTEDNH